MRNIDTGDEIVSLYLREKEREREGSGKEKRRKIRGRKERILSRMLVTDRGHAWLARRGNSAVTPKKGSLLAREAREPRESRGRPPRPLRRPRRPRRCGAARPRESAPQVRPRDTSTWLWESVGLMKLRKRESPSIRSDNKSRAGLTSARLKSPVILQKYCRGVLSTILFNFEFISYFECTKVLFGELIKIGKSSQIFFWFRKKIK